MIRIEAPASLRPSERYGLEVLIDLSRLLVAQSADCEVVRLTVGDRPSAGSAAADLSAQAALERLDARSGWPGLAARSGGSGRWGNGTAQYRNRSARPGPLGGKSASRGRAEQAPHGIPPGGGASARGSRGCWKASDTRLGPVARPSSVGRAVDPRSRRGGLVGAIPAAPHAGAEHERLVGSGRPSRPGRQDATLDGIRSLAGYTRFSSWKPTMGSAQHGS